MIEPQWKATKKGVNLPDAPRTAGSGGREGPPMTRPMECSFPSGCRDRSSSCIAEQVRDDVSDVAAEHEFDGAGLREHEGYPALLAACVAVAMSPSPVCTGEHDRGCDCIGDQVRAALESFKAY